MILVIGGTGTVGSHVLAALTTQGVPTRALIRRQNQQRQHEQAPIKFQLGDATDASAVRSALVGVDQVFLALSNGPQQLEAELNVVRESARSGVSHIVKLSAPRVGPDVPVRIARMHFDIEQAIAETDMKATFLRPYAFMQNLLQAHLKTINQSGMFFGITGEQKMNWVDARDIADVAVLALTASDCRRGALVLTGPCVVSYPQIAEMLSTNRQRVTYVNQRDLTMRRGMDRAGLPAWLIEHIIEIQHLALTHPESTTTTFQEITGRSPRSLEAFLQEHAEEFQPPRWTKPAPFHWLASRALN